MGAIVSLRNHFVQAMNQFSLSVLEVLKRGLNFIMNGDTVKKTF